MIATAVLISSVLKSGLTCFGVNFVTSFCECCQFTFHSAAYWEECTFQTALLGLLAPLLKAFFGHFTQHWK